MEQNKTSGVLLIVLVAIVLSAGIGYIIGQKQSKYGAYGTSSGSLNSNDNAEVQRLQAQIEQAKKFFPQISDVRTVSGTIKSINGNVILIESDNTIQNPFEKSIKSRSITVNGNTKITKLENKDQATFQKELDDFQSKMKTQKADGTPQLIQPPAPFIEKQLSLDDLKVGDKITADASENIKEKDSFEATRIVMQVFSSTINSPVMPPTQPAGQNPMVPPPAP